MKCSLWYFFCEPYANSPTLNHANIEALLKEKTVAPRMVIVDYTGSGLNVDIGRWFELLDTNTALILITSLQKTFQEGDDLTPGGMITLLEKGNFEEGSGEPDWHVDKRALEGVRAMTGANISTHALSLLRSINIERAQERSMRIGKNVLHIARAIEEMHSPLFKNIRYAPENSMHASESLLISLEFDDEFYEECLQAIRTIIDLLVLIAGRKGVSLIKGDSFGFNTTRVMFHDSSLRSLRIAPGTENIIEVQKIIKVFREVFGGLPRT